MLGAVIDRLKIRENYNLHYRDFLLGQMSEQEFEAVAEQFAYTPKIVELGELARNVQVLFDYTREEFTSSEVAELFRVTQDDVEQALRQMPLLLTGGSVIHADT